METYLWRGPGVGSIESVMLRALWTDRPEYEAAKRASEQIDVGINEKTHD